MDYVKDLRCLTPQIFESVSLYRSKVSFQFPKDDNLLGVDNLSMCDNSSLFSDFNKKFHTFRKIVKLYQLSFNLNDLSEYTKSSLTESVTIFADTIYMSGPLDITYNLTIRARTVALSYPITLTYDRNQYNLPKEMMTRYVSFDDQLVMRQRMFGFIDIVDQHNYENKSTPCQPSYSLSDELDLDGWFDPTIVNMLHVCIYPLLADEKSEETGRKLIDFVLNFYQKKTDVNDMTAYMAAKKFLKFKEKQEEVRIHKVPNYVLEDILILSDSLYNSFDQLWKAVMGHEERVLLLKDDIFNANEQFELVEEQLKNLVELEKASFLNSIMLANVSMMTSFEHR